MCWTVDSQSAPELRCGDDAGWCELLAVTVMDQQEESISPC